MPRINIINVEQFIKALKQLECGDKPFAAIDAKDFEMPFIDINPPEGYEPPPNFPNCCKFHKGIHKSVKERFKKFPNCCEYHKNLLQATWFKKNNYKNVADKVTNQVSYTEHIIRENIDKPEWFKSITDYIHYNVQSFGHFPTGNGNPIGLDDYLYNVKHWIDEMGKLNSFLSKEKAEKLMEFVNNYSTPKPIVSDSLEVLYDTYKKWLNVFPFDVSYFKELKKQYEKRLPFIEGGFEINAYSGLASARIIPQARLIEALGNTTKELLSKIDSVKQVQQGLIPDTVKHTMELVNESHKLKQVALLNSFTSGEIEYVKTSKDWLENEKVYFREITPLFKNVVKSQKEKDYELYIDTSFNYYKNLNEFKHKLLSDKLNNSPQKYFQILHVYKEKYGNSGYYHIQYTGGNLGDEHIAIKKYVEEEILRLAVVFTPSQSTNTITSFKNNFDTVNEIEVYNHFKKGLCEKHYIDENDLLKYLSLAFDEQKKPTQKFHFKNVTVKQKVIKVFYSYYKDVAGKPNRAQRKYAALLTDYFEGYKIEYVSTNFSK